LAFYNVLTLVIANDHGDLLCMLIDGDVQHSRSPGSRCLASHTGYAVFNYQENHFFSSTPLSSNQVKLSLRDDVGQHPLLQQFGEQNDILTLIDESRGAV
jgi:hypothetical protein